MMTDVPKGERVGSWYVVLLFWGGRSGERQTGGGQSVRSQSVSRQPAPFLLAGDQLSFSQLECLVTHRKVRQRAVDGEDCGCGSS
jgi:hypothetical protein